MGTRREEHEDAGRRREEVDRAQRAQMQKPDEKEVSLAAYFLCRSCPKAFD
jgi:hypothetical protein